ncbi:MAG: replicative DNA helicase, partial [Synechococcus sp.]|nr:replicative DNA helicase [Synechococcus sp.]
MVSVPLAGGSSASELEPGGAPPGGSAQGGPRRGRRSQEAAEFEALSDAVPPQNMEAEEAVLGGILLDPEA